MDFNLLHSSIFGRFYFLYSSWRWKKIRFVVTLQQHHSALSIRCLAYYRTDNGALLLQPRCIEEDSVLLCGSIIRLKDIIKYLLFSILFFRFSFYLLKSQRKSRARLLRWSWRGPLVNYDLALSSFWLVESLCGWQSYILQLRHPQPQI